MKICMTATLISQLTLLLAASGVNAKDYKYVASTPLECSTGFKSLAFPDGSMFNSLDNVEKMLSICDHTENCDGLWTNIPTIGWYMMTCNGASTVTWPTDGRCNSGCFTYIDVSFIKENTGGGGDPHFKTWTDEHFEYHGQCSMVLAEDINFSDGLGIAVHIRTKLVRYWSYIESAAVKIGNDIIEIQGSAEPSKDKNNYWFNFEPQGELDEMSGFPITVKAPSPIKRVYEIDLSSKYPGHSIVVSTLKEFVRVDFKNSSNEAYGKMVGLLGDFETGKTLARDGITVIDDFSQLGKEWQVRPTEPKLFHNFERPQFPEPCLEPEDPRGERKRRRRLGEATVTEEQAEAACAHLSDPADRKDCVYDIVATQDLDMVGAY